MISLVCIPHRPGMVGRGLESAVFLCLGMLFEV